MTETRDPIERTLELGLIPGELQNSKAVALEINERIKSMLQEHVPAKLIAAIAFAPMKRMFDGAVCETELAIDLGRRQTLGLELLAKHRLK